jgi:hypothetical protein
VHSVGAVVSEKSCAVEAMLVAPDEPTPEKS